MTERSLFRSSHHDEKDIFMCPVSTLVLLFLPVIVVLTVWKLKFRICAGS